MNRAIIIGNSGSGKTYLANRLSQAFSVPVTHLDELFWEPGGFTQKRPKEVVLYEISILIEKEQWIVEGVFGELAKEFTKRADSLIWLDMDWEYCRTNLLHRGSESSRQLDPAQAEISFGELLEWASHYWNRDDLRSHLGHDRLFSNFSGTKYCLKSRDDVNHFLSMITNDLGNQRDQEIGQ